MSLFKTLGVVGGLSFLIFGGIVFGTALDEVNTRAKISRFLSACPPDEMRFVSYLGYGGRYVNLILNFSNRLPLASTWDDHLRPWGLFWRRGLPPVSPTIWGPIGDPRPNYPNTMVAWHPTGQGLPYTQIEMVRVKKALAALPESRLFASEDGDLMHLAFWQDGHLRICDYTRHDAQRSLYNLDGWLGISLADF
jgi:hypothetical protein